MTRYFLPNPCAVAPEILAAQAIPPEYVQRVTQDELAERIREEFFPSVQEVHFFPCVREGLYQMVIDWLAEKRILLAVNGPMSQDWLAIAVESGAKISIFDFAAGSAMNLKQFGLTLSQGIYDAVIIIETDVYTGTQLNFSHIASLVRSKQPDALLINDCSGSIFAVSQPTMESQADIYVCCSEMALGLPPGLGIIAANAHASTRLMAHTIPQWLFDYSRQTVNRKEKKLHARAPYPLINALRVRVENVLAIGADEERRRIAELQAIILDWAERHAFGIAAEEGVRAVNATALILPEQFTPDTFIDYLASYGFYLGHSFGDLRNRAILISHNTSASPDDLRLLTKAMERFLIDYDTRSRFSLFR